MADITTTTILSENDRQIVMAFQYQFVDTGNEDAVKKVDVSTLIKNAAGESCTAVRIVEAWWTIFGMTVQVEADASTDVIILHLDENSANGDTCSGVRIAECWWVIKGMTTEILADANTDIIILHLDENQSGYQDYSVFGGLPKTTAYGSSPTGDIFFTTTGAGAVTDTYQICFRMIKEY